MPDRPSLESVIRVRMHLLELAKDLKVLQYFQDAMVQYAELVLAGAGKQAMAETTPAEVFTQAIAWCLSGQCGWETNLHPTFLDFFQNLIRRSVLALTIRSSRGWSPPPFGTPPTPASPH